MIYCGDCLEVLKTLEAESVQCVVTSPPYYGLRDYGTAKWEGGELGCDHLRPPLGGCGKETLVGTTANENMTRFQQFRDLCPKCGAARIDSQLGLEPTLDCGLQKFVKLKPDLSEADLEYVVQELKSYGYFDE